MTEEEGACVGEDIFGEIRAGGLVTNSSAMAELRNELPTNVFEDLEVDAIVGRAACDHFRSERGIRGWRPPYLGVPTNKGLTHSPSPFDQRAETNR